MKIFGSNSDGTNKVVKFEKNVQLITLMPRI